MSIFKETVLFAKAMGYEVLPESSALMVYVADGDRPNQFMPLIDHNEILDAIKKFGIGVAQIPDTDDPHGAVWMPGRFEDRVTYRGRNKLNLAVITLVARWQAAR